MLKHFQRPLLILAFVVSIAGVLFLLSLMPRAAFVERGLVMVLGGMGFYLWFCRIKEMGKT